MFGFHRLAIVIVVVAGGVTAYSVDRSRRPTERADTLRDSSRTRVGPTEPSPHIREAELGRRAQRPADEKERKRGAAYDSILEGRDADRTPSPLGPPPPMPLTSCRSVQPVRKDSDHFSGPNRIHDTTVMMFENASGFGANRLLHKENRRGISVASSNIARFELVSLLTEYDESAYVLEEMATPARARKAVRRPLDEFERLGLDAVRRGENVVWTPEAPTRMFGAIRAKASCLECHADAKVGDLLGAFTYYLDVPVDRLAFK